MKNIINKSINYFIEDFQKRPWFLLLETVATMLGLTGAITLSIFNENANFLFIWICYLISSLVLAYVGFKRESTNIMVLMSIYTIINGAGLINTLIG